jgi:hypothetical protein
LDDLERKFGDIETFFATFPGDENIKKASVDLIVSTLKAIEDVIRYYAKNHSELRNPTRPFLPNPA